MRNRVVHVCFDNSSVSDLTVRQQRLMPSVLRALKNNGRMSIFAATENAAIAKTLTDAEKRGLIVVTPDAYPWSDVVLTEAGEALIATP